MTLLLSGTDGLSDVDGSAATPAIRGTDANTGIFFPAADTIAFAEGGAEVARFDSAGNLLVGTTTTGSVGISLSASYNLGWGQNSGESVPNIFRQTSSAATVMANGYRNSATANGFASSLSSSYAKSAISCGTVAGGITFYTDTAAAVAAGTDVTPTERMRLDSSGNVGIGTSSPQGRMTLQGAAGTNGINQGLGLLYSTGIAFGALGLNNSTGWPQLMARAGAGITFHTDSDLLTTNERMRIDSNGNLYIFKTSSSVSTVGIEMITNGRLLVTSLDQDCLVLNRQSTDGTLAEFRHANTTEGTISISGTTVSYNGGHLARWSQLLDNSKDESILKGTVLSNLDEMCVWEKDGVVADNEQLNKMKVSDVEGDTNVAGVFVNWTRDEDCNTDDMNIAMTGDMIIRIAEGVTVQRGDLLMSAGDGTAKPQGDDIVRGKTVANVTSTHITCTYADGSYCVPCVLMAC
jgi:hypothetical protein